MENTIVILFLVACAFLILGFLEESKTAVFIGAMLFLVFSLIVPNIKDEPNLKAEPKINLPEEIDQLKPTDTLKGYYDSKGVLHIEFNNKRNQKWKNIQ